MKSAATRFAFCLTLLPAMVAECGVRASDDLARSAIFAEQHVDDSALSLLQRTRELTADDRYRVLSDWILPGATHPTLRVQAAFTPTGPAPPVAAALGEPLPEAGRRLPSGGRLVSPVLTLIDTAAELGRLDELHTRVADWSAEDAAGALDQTSVLALIEVARGNLDAAAQHLEQLSAQRSARRTANGDETAIAATPPSAAELLVLERGFDVPPLRDLVTDTLAYYRAWMLSEYGRPVPHRYVTGLLARLQIPLQTDDEGEPLRPVSRQPLTQWHTASRSTASTRGVGQPAADWLWRPGFAGNTSSHADDYLIFNTPLLGEYDVECDVTGFEWRDSSLLVAGHWVIPIYTHKHVDVGSFHGRRPRIEFTPPLTKTRAWIHYRTVVRDGAATTYLNGRPVHSERLRNNDSPWVAIRSTQQHDGAVRNLRITGVPEIPSEVRLSAVDTLNDWLPYFEGVESAINEPLWSVVSRGGADNEITGLGTNPGVAVTASDSNGSVADQESLLRYFRPMVEDGVIDYEFYYVPGLVHAHPALDRLAFLLQPDGVRIHWITDGPFDRTSLTADNVVDEPSHRRGPAALPLQTDDWNRLRLALHGDTVSLTLNDELIYERPLEATNQRTFGLFHFANRSTLKVRRVVWRGDWPRELPPVADQELATPEAEFLDKDLDHLAATFEHNFARDGLPISQFTVVRGNAGTHLQPTPDGLLATRDGTGGYQNATVAPALEIGGDFDIVAEYNQFAAETALGGNATVALLAILENDAQEEAMLTRRQFSRSPDQTEQFMQCVVVERIGNDARRNYLLVEPTEESSGRLRLARRGDQLYYLTGENDSPHDRLRMQRRFATDPIALDGLRLLTQVYGDGGGVRVVWKRLSIRAEQLSGRAISGRNTVVANLNAERDKLPAQFTHDFRKQEPTDEQFFQWGTLSRWQPAPAGWLISAEGTDNWTSSGLSLLRRIEGDFDATFRFDPETLATPKPGQHSQVYLQMEFSDKDRTSISAIFTLEPNGETAALAQVRERAADGSYNYRVIGQTAVGKANALRIARRGSMLTFLAAGSVTEDDEVIADYELSTVPIERRNLQLMLHTGGADRVSTARWQSLDIRAAKIDGATGPNQPPPPPGLLDRVIDFFK